MLNMNTVTPQDCRGCGNRTDLPLRPAHDHRSFPAGPYGPVLSADERTGKAAGGVPLGSSVL